MGYKQFLETRIYQLCSFICEHEKIIQTTSRPEERVSSEQAIEAHWERIKYYLRQYVPLCKKLQVEPPEEIREIIGARFPEMLKNCSSAFVNGIVATDSTLLLPVEVFENHWGFLYEWKELHNLLQEIITSLSPLMNALEFAPDEEQTRIDFGLRLWRQVRLQLRRLESFSREIKYIGEPFDDANGAFKGVTWMVEIASLRNELEECLCKGDFVNAYNLATELLDICLTHLYGADKRLRDAIEEIRSIFGTLLRGY